MEVLDVYFCHHKVSIINMKKDMRPGQHASASIPVSALNLECIMCYPCPRTPVTYVYVLYREGLGGVVGSENAHTL